MTTPGSVGHRRSAPAVALVVWHSSPAAPPGAGWAGGMNVYARAIARELAATGVAVDVWTAARDGQPRVRRDGSLRTIEIPSGWLADGADYERIERRLSSRGVGLPSRYDAVHAHYWRSVPLGCAMAEHRDAPLFYTFHTIGRVRDRFRIVDEPPQPAERARLEGKAMRDAQAVIVSCAQEADELIATYGAGARCVKTIAPGVDRAVFGQGRPSREHARRQAEALLLAVSRIDPVKGLDLAIEAAAAVARSTRRRVQLAIAGGPSGHAGAGEMRRLRAVARRVSGPRCQIRFLGQRNQLAVARLYRRADVTLVSSYSESCGLVTLESLASGTPVVATDVGIVPEVVQAGANGDVARGRDVADYAARIGRLLLDADPRRLRAAAVETAHGYSWSLAARELAGLYGFESICP